MRRERELAVLYLRVLEGLPRGVEVISLTRRVDGAFGHRGGAEGVIAPSILSAAAAAGPAAEFAFAVAVARGRVGGARGCVCVGRHARGRSIETAKTRSTRLAVARGARASRAAKTRATAGRRARERGGSVIRCLQSQLLAKGGFGEEQ